MAIIISYPSAGAVASNDLLLGTRFDAESGANITKNFSVGSIVNFTLASLTSEGATGTFETADSKLVTVTDGIITSITVL